MITSLSVENFKSWKSIDEMRLAPITGLFGTNSSGKTSILQLLLLLKQTVDSADRNIALDLGDNRALVSLGTLRDVLYNHDTTQSLSWSLTWEPEQTVHPDDQGAFYAPGHDMGYHGAVVLSEVNEPVVRQFGYSYKGGSVGMTRNEDGKYDLDLAPAPEFEMRRDRGPLPRPVKSYGFPHEVREHLLGSDFLSDYVLQYQRLFDKVHYLGPLHDSPLRVYSWAGGEPPDVGTRGEVSVGALLAARSKGHDLQSRVASKLAELDLIRSFSVDELAPGSDIYQVHVRTSEGSAEVLLPDVGFGVAHVLPVVVLCYYVPTGSIILLEQPEMHLHPKAQMALADVLIDAVKTNKVQIIVESHSEHLLQRLQRRIAEQELSPDDVALYFCGQSDGASRLTPLHVNQQGYITNWPEGFFGDPFAEAVKMADAAQGQGQ